MIKILKNIKIDFTSKFKFANYLSLIIIMIGLVSYFFKGPEFGVDFKGGTELIVELDSDYTNRSNIANYLDENDIQYSNIKSYGDNKVRILFDFDIDKEVMGNQLNIISYNKIGSTISNELKHDALQALLIAMLLIIESFKLHT